MIGQVWIETGERYELRHEADRSRSPRALVTHRDPFAARTLATFTDDGKYRPLRSAPNLRRGWRIVGLDFPKAVAALDCFYPGAVAHWHAWKRGKLAVTSYRSCAARQTGMYRITTKLGADEVRRVAACCCSDGECLKVPLWDVDERTKLATEKPSRPASTLAIPCPEPCSLLLSFARKAVRLEQEEPMNVKLTKSDLELIGGVLRGVLAGGAGRFREGDYNDPWHRQRIEYFLRKYEKLFPKREADEENQDEN